MKRNQNWDPSYLESDIFEPKNLNYLQYNEPEKGEEIPDFC